MASAPSPFFTNSTFGAGVSNLARAFAGPDPGERELAEQRAAAAGLSRAQTGEINQRLGAFNRAGDLARSPGSDPGALAAIGAEMLRSGNPGAISQLGDVFRTLGFNAGVTPERGAALFQGAGGNYAGTQLGFEQKDATDRRNQDVQTGGQVQSARIGAGATIGAANIGARAGITREEMQQAGLDRRMVSEINPGNVAVVPQNSPLRSSADANGRIEGNMRPQTFDQARAGLVQEFLQPPPGAAPQRTERVREIISPQIVTAETRGGAAQTPLTVNGNEVKAIGEQIDAQSVDDQGPFTFAPPARQAVGLRATELYRDGPYRGNMPAAVKAAIDEYRRGAVRTDSSLNPFSDRTYGARPGGAQAAPQPSGRPAPGAVVRQNGRTYVIQPDGSARPAS